MDEDPYLQSLILVILILGACYFAASEIAFASMNTVRMKTESKKGNKKATNALLIAENFDKALITLLIGNNLTHIGFASLVTLMATKLWGVSSVKYTAIAATIVLFFISELVPKGYAKANSEKFALKVSGSLLIVMKIFSPIAKAFSLISVVLEAILPKKHEEKITDEELLDIIEVAHSEGSLDDEETDLVKLAIQFEEKKVRDVYIKIQDVDMIEIEQKNQEIIDKIKLNRYSRMPVYDKTRENIVGILQASLYLKRYLEDKNTMVKEIMNEPIFVDEDKLINDLLTELSSNKFHMAVVRDKGNKTMGIVTLEDILEELVGEIWDESDHDAKALFNLNKIKKNLV